MKDAYVQWLVSVVDCCRRRALLTLVCACLLSGGCIAYAWSHMAISTDTSNLLSDKLPFTRAQAAFAHTFPRSGNSIVIILDGDTADGAADGADKLSAWLTRHHHTIRHVFSPGTNTFFRKNGLLYLDVKNLTSVAGQLTEMQPVLARLARNPSLPGLVSLVQEALERDASGKNKAPAKLGRLLDAWGAAIEAAKHQRFFIFPWHEIMMGDSSSSQERRRIIEVTPHLNTSEILPAQQAIALIRQGIRKLKLDPAHGIHVRLTGEAMLDYEQLQGAMRAAGLATGISALLVLLLLLIALKDIRLVLAVTLTLTMSLIWTGAFALLATAPLNLISISFAVLFIGMGVDFGIQFCIRCRHEATAGIQADEAIRRTSKGLGAALGLSALAAAASFFSFAPTAYKGLADLGIIAGSGMFIALAATFTVLPALMSLLRRPRPAQASIPASVSDPVPVSEIILANWISTHAKPIVGVAFALMLASMMPTLKLHFDFNPLHLLNAHNPAFKAFKALARESKASPYAIEIMTPNLAGADRLAATIRKQNTVSRVLTLSSLIPDKQQQKLSILSDLTLLMPSFTLQTRHMPALGPALIAASLKRLQQALDQYALHAGNTPLASHVATLSRRLTNFLHSDVANTKALQALDSNITSGLVKRIQMLATALTAHKIGIRSLPDAFKKRFLAVGGQARIQVFSKLDLDVPGNMERFVRQIQAIAPSAVGDPVMMVEGGAAVAHAFLQASLLALGFVTILLIASLGSIRDCVGVLLPLLLAALVTSASMDAINMSLNLANIIVLPLLAGLGVSYGIYLALGQREAGIHELFQSATPHAVLFSALTTLCSFGSMAVSGDAAMMMLGKTLAIALICVLISVLIVQPALLSLWPGKKRPTAAPR